jgi:hypothetical protein
MPFNSEYQKGLKSILQEIEGLDSKANISNIYLADISDSLKSIDAQLKINNKKKNSIISESAILFLIVGMIFVLGWFISGASLKNFINYLITVSGRNFVEAVWLPALCIYIVVYGYHLFFTNYAAIENAWGKTKWRSILLVSAALTVHFGFLIALPALLFWFFSKSPDLHLLIK